MLDKRTALVLMSINKMCSNGSFQVIEVEDLIASMPKKYMADINLITQSINALERNGYIEVKYHDKNVFCLCPLPKGRFEFENIVEGVEKDIFVGRGYKFWRGRSVNFMLIFRGSTF